jgi:Flp pilus assembly protein TadG
MVSCPANRTERPPRLRRRGAHAGQRRSGLACVELALCLPVLLATALGMIEITNLVFVQARLQSVAYEGARAATRPTTSTTLALTSAQVVARCNVLLAQLGVKNATVTVSPVSLANLVPQSQVTVTVSASLSQNAATSFILINPITLTAQATMIIE